MAAQREWLEKDFYKTLGVTKGATAKEITKAYRKLARDLHPDKNPGNTKAEERFKEVSAAYDVLSDDTKRGEYDELRRMGAMGGFRSGPAGGPGGAGGFGGFQPGAGGPDISDLLGQMFGGRGRKGRGAHASESGADLTSTLSLDLAEAVRGITTAIHLSSEGQCSSCAGSGAATGTRPERCTACGGSGVTDDNQGLFSFSSPCRVCHGNGVTIANPCPTCRGTGAETRPREVKVRIPAGVKDGQTVRLRGKGAPGRNGGNAGDLLIKVKIVADDVFGRSGNNLTTTVPVTFAEAVLGGTIEVPTMDGPTVTLRLKPGTASGSRHRVKGKGITTTSKRNGTKTGDLIVTVNVDVPTELSKAQRAAVEQLAAATTVNPRKVSP